MSVINVSIDCSKIDKSKLVQGKYLNFSLSNRKEVGQYGETHTMTYQQTKEERESKTPKVYLAGNAKEIVFKNESNPVKDIIGGSSNVTDDESDLPF